MKKVLALVMTLSMLLCIPMMEVKAGEAEAQGINIVCSIENGSYVIDMPVSDLGWIAECADEDESVVKLGSAEMEDDRFLVRFDPVSDGEASVNIRHYLGTACVEMLTWDLAVADGAVQESTGGSHAAVSDDDGVDPYMTGQWTEKEGSGAVLDVERNPERGWDVVITASDAENPYIFKTSIYQDCYVDGFVYDKGKFWDIPAEENAELGEAKIMGSTGYFAFGADSAEILTLEWHSDETEEVVSFVRDDISVPEAEAPADAEETAEAENPA